MRLISFCVGCRYEKENKNEEPCAFTCESRIIYASIIEDDMYVPPKEFVRGYKKISFEELCECLKDPKAYRKKMKNVKEIKTPRYTSDGTRGRYEPGFGRLNHKNMKQGYKHCSKCPPETGPQPLSNFYKNKRGFRGVQTMCKKCHSKSYYKGEK